MTSKKPFSLKSEKDNKNGTGSQLSLDLTGRHRFVSVFRLCCNE
jgi:hypothetical protein